MKVGFHVNSLRSYQSKDFMVFFHLWGHGGPDYIREFRAWEQEELQSWTVVGQKKRNAQTADVTNHGMVLNGGPQAIPTGANATKQGPPPKCPAGSVKVAAPSAAVNPVQVIDKSMYSAHRPIFLHKLSAQEILDLKGLIIAGHNFYSIQEFFRIIYGHSSLDKFTKEEELDLKYLISANLSNEQIGFLLSDEGSSSTVPATSVLNV